MADAKISALPAATTPVAGTEVLPIVQSSTTVKLAISDITPGLSVITTAKGGTGQTSLAAASIATYTGTETLTNKTFTGYTETVYALSGTAIDPANGTIQTKTLGASTTFTESLADGQSVVLMLNPVTYTVTWPTMTWINVAGSGSAPTLEASSTNVVVMWQVGGTVYGNWAGSA